MKIIIPINDPQAKNAPPAVLSKAERHGKDILKVVWDREDGYPPYSWGYVEWSVRPYTQRQGCDGTIDGNVHLIALRFCQALGLNYADIHTEAYAWQEQGDQGQWIREWSPTDIADLEKETVIPDLDEQSLKSLLYDLNDINNRSVIEVLEREFSRLGYNVENWHELKGVS